MVASGSTTGSHHGWKETTVRGPGVSMRGERLKRTCLAWYDGRVRAMTGTRHDRSARFASTRWSVVLLCADDQEGTVQHQAALEEFCQIYWSPVHAFLLRRGHAPADAQDLAQSFFASLLERRSYAAADPAKGRFRTFLVTALKHFLADQHDRQQAAKRGGGFQFLALTPALVDAEPAAFTDAAAGKSSVEQLERFFDQQWAATLVERALSLLGEELVQEGRGKLFAALLPVLRPGSLPPPGQEELAASLQMPLATLRTHLHRLRRRYRSIVRAEVARTVAHSDDVEGELRHLIDILVER